ncbi:MAG: hypothetical protein WA958_01405 [Tunicatimonas sp.]
MAKTIDITADLTIELDGDKVKVTNDSDGDLVINFPSKQTLGKFLKTRFALSTDFSSLNRVNKLLRKEQQPVILRVNYEDWVVLGRYDNPVIKYAKLAPLLLDNTFSDRKDWYVLAGVLGGSVLAVLLYRLIKTRG